MVNGQKLAQEINFRTLLIRLSRVEFHLNEFKCKFKILLNSILKISHLHDHVIRLSHLCDVTRQALIAHWPNSLQSYSESWFRFLEIRRSIEAIEELGTIFCFPMPKEIHPSPISVLDRAHFAECNCIMHNDFWPDTPLWESAIHIPNKRRNSI